MKRRDHDHQMILLGAHFSIAGGLHKAVFSASEYGCTALQIFTKNASTWKERRLSAHDVKQFDVARIQTGIRWICSHAAYLINLASPDRSKYERSIKALEHELVRSSQLSIPYVIMHPGSHMGEGEDKGLRRISEGINKVFDHVPEATCQLVLETTAGQGSNLGYTFEQLAAISDMVKPKERVGFCLDTCHVFAAGYDLRTKTAYQETMQAFERVIGLDRLRVIHLNDTKKGLGSRIDRHEHIGKGAIGIDAFSFILNDPQLKALPKIIETPKKKGPIDHDRMNLNRLRSLIE
ncbi:MAG: deoxyribonuclease IV [Desulfobacterales bacterium]|nr:deoxyribonuclease IV [Desulfobacterales bacterium]